MQFRERYRGGFRDTATMMCLLYPNSRMLCDVPFISLGIGFGLGSFRASGDDLVGGSSKVN